MTKGYYIYVGGKRYGSKTKAAQMALQGKGLQHAPISYWDGVEWRNTGSILHADGNVMADESRSLRSLKSEWKAQNKAREKLKKPRSERSWLLRKLFGI